LAGKPTYTVTGGEAFLDGANILDMLPENRARAGLFLSFQHPVEVPGVRLDQFLRAGYNAVRKSKGIEEVDVLKFNRLLKQKVELMGADANLIQRYVNEGFSGGEKKRNEILQLAVMEPTLAILDEPDSGLDVDAVRIVADGINQLRRSDSATILITHYQRILNYVVPDVVHILVDGRIARTGGKELALEVEEEGYDKYEMPVGADAFTKAGDPA
jgi:Fe-S cluster assembly ATP-binding protein